MRFTVEYPVGGPDYDTALLSRAGLSRIAAAADQLGFDALAFTEHPAPSLKWLRHGGHETFDPVAALAFCAAATRRIGLMSYLFVAPYHNPFAAAKAFSTIDLLSGGRLTVVAGTGYLRSEFRALGVDFDDRNARFDECLQAMRGAWTHIPYNHDGEHFHAKDLASLPRPSRVGGPPVLIGGNSTLARRRAAQQQGWSPLLVSELVAQTSRTTHLTLADLPHRIASVRQDAISEQGDGTTLTVQVQSAESAALRGDFDADSHRQYLGVLARAGVDQFVVQIPCTSVSAAIEGLAAYADSFIGRT